MLHTLKVFILHDILLMVFHISYSSHFVQPSTFFCHTETHSMSCLATDVLAAHKTAHLHFAISIHVCLCLMAFSTEFCICHIHTSQWKSTICSTGTTHTRRSGKRDIYILRDNKLLAWKNAGVLMLFLLVQIKSKSFTDSIQLTCILFPCENQQTKLCIQMIRFVFK